MLHLVRLGCTSLAFCSVFGSCVLVLSAVSTVHTTCMCSCHTCVQSLHNSTYTWLNIPHNAITHDFSHGMMYSHVLHSIRTHSESVLASSVSDYTYIRTYCVHTYVHSVEHAFGCRS